MLINYPEPQFRVKKDGGKDFIFDTIRKKWIVLTPEEWVRQNFIRFLVAEKKYPQELVAVEKEITVGELKKRFDILVYDSHHQPWMMVECKSMDVMLDESVFQQVLRYHSGIPVKYLLVTNGTYCHGWLRSDQQLHQLDGIPAHNS